MATELPQPQPATDLVISAPSEAILAAKLVEAGILVMGEAGATAPQPLTYSFIRSGGGKAHAWVDIPLDVSNRDAMLAVLPADWINAPGAPLRAKVGSVPPEVVEALDDFIYRKALASLGLEAAWTAAIDAVITATSSKDVAIWWDRALKITTLETEWRAIADAMVWDKSSEVELIDTAKNIAGAQRTPAAEREPT